MSPFPRRDRDGGRGAMAMHGDTVAWGLCDGCAGDPDRRTGWRGALQSAADASDHDEDILRLADEIYAFAHLMRTPAAIRTYADAARTTVAGEAGSLFLAGMLHHLDQRTGP